MTSLLGEHFYLCTELRNIYESSLQEEIYLVFLCPDLVVLFIQMYFSLEYFFFSFRVLNLLLSESGCVNAKLHKPLET